jgi:hypothetical protein
MGPMNFLGFFDINVEELSVLEVTSYCGRVINRQPRRFHVVSMEIKKAAKKAA